jgi:hypothetical protein
MLLGLGLLARVRKGLACTGHPDELIDPVPVALGTLVHGGDFAAFLEDPATCRGREQ